MSWIATAIIGSAVVGGIASNSAARRAANAQRGASDAAALQAQIGAEQWERYQEIYDPLERDLIQDAREYDSPAAYERAAGDAQATVASQFGKARDRLTRTPGLDPSSPGYASQMVGLDLAQAATDATQQNAARMRVKDTAWARKQDAMSLGKGLPGQASSMLSNSANTMGNIAASQYGLAQSQAANAGQLVNRVFNPTTMNQFSSWLNSSGPGLGYGDAGSAAAYSTVPVGGPNGGFVGVI